MSCSVIQTQPFPLCMTVGFQWLTVNDQTICLLLNAYEYEYDIIMNMTICCFVDCSQIKSWLPWIWKAQEKSLPLVEQQSWKQFLVSSVSYCDVVVPMLAGIKTELSLSHTGQLSLAILHGQAYSILAPVMATAREEKASFAVIGQYWLIKEACYYWRWSSDCSYMCHNCVYCSRLWRYALSCAESDIKRSVVSS